MHAFTDNCSQALSCVDYHCRFFALHHYPEQPKEPRLNDARRRFNLALPPSGNPRSRELARQWRQRYPDPQQRIQAAMNYFREQPFFYTLQPPPVSGDSIDGFLFSTRAGFCALRGARRAENAAGAGSDARLFRCPARV